MAAPHYIAQRIGDKYVLIRKGGPSKPGKREFLIAGAITTGLGLFHDGVHRRRMLTIGTTLLAVAYLCSPRSGKPSTKRVRRFTRGPSYQNEDDGLKPRQKPQDDIDEASMESFPASDPPSHTPRE